MFQSAKLIPFKEQNIGSICDEQLGDYIGTNFLQVAMVTESGKSRKTLAANTRQIFRIIQTIPSKKAEPFKHCLAEIAKQWIDQLQDPELSIEQAMVEYKRLGYTDNWINQRLIRIKIRKEISMVFNSKSSAEHINVTNQAGGVTKEARQKLEVTQ